MSSFFQRRKALSKMEEKDTSKLCRQRHQYKWQCTYRYRHLPSFQKNKLSKKQLNIPGFEVIFLISHMVSVWVTMSFALRVLFIYHHLVQMLSRVFNILVFGMISSQYSRTFQGSQLLPHHFWTNLYWNVPILQVVFLWSKKFHRKMDSLPFNSQILWYLQCSFHKCTVCIICQVLDYKLHEIVAFMFGYSMDPQCLEESMVHINTEKNVYGMDACQHVIKLISCLSPLGHGITFPFRAFAI